MKNRARNWWKPAACGVSMLFGAALHAQPVLIARGEGVVVILHSEPCQQAAVTNLKGRATWEEKGVVIEGCWGHFQQVGLVLMYFSDKTVTALPVTFFERTGGT